MSEFICKQAFLCLMCWSFWLGLIFWLNRWRLKTVFCSSGQSLELHYGSSWFSLAGYGHGWSPTSSQGIRRGDSFCLSRKRKAAKFIFTVTRNYQTEPQGCTTSICNICYDSWQFVNDQKTKQKRIIRHHIDIFENNYNLCGSRIFFLLVQNQRDQSWEPTKVRHLTSDTFSQYVRV